MFYLHIPFVFTHVIKNDYLSTYVNTWTLQCKFQMPEKNGKVKHTNYVGKIIDII